MESKGCLLCDFDGGYKKRWVEALDRKPTTKTTFVVPVQEELLVDTMDVRSNGVMDAIHHFHSYVFPFWVVYLGRDQSLIFVAVDKAPKCQCSLVSTSYEVSTRRDLMKTKASASPQFVMQKGKALGDLRFASGWCRRWYHYVHFGDVKEYLNRKRYCALDAFHAFLYNFEVVLGYA
jgi:hypothetical protein